MEQRKKIERLAKAMGWTMACPCCPWVDKNGEDVANGISWNPWGNPADLRQVIEYVESVHWETLGKFIEAVNEIVTPSSNVKGVRLAIMTPHIIADAALAVLEGE